MSGDPLRERLDTLQARQASLYMCDALHAVLDECDAMIGTAAVDVGHRLRFLIAGVLGMDHA